MKPLRIIKTIEQIERKYKRVQKKLRILNDPAYYGDRKLTLDESLALERAVAEWQMLAWLTGRYGI